VTYLWHALARRGLDLRATDKMMVGFLLTTLCMGVMSAAGFLSTPTAKVSVLWEIVAYVIITVAEICISVVGLELAFTAAPKTMKSFVTACWLLTVFLGNLITIPLARFKLYQELGPGPFFAGIAVTMIVIAVIFLGIGRRFQRQSA
jgi:dipeptide/tripeptide permease